MITARDTIIEAQSKQVMPVYDYVMIVFIKNKNRHHSIRKSGPIWDVITRFRSLRFFMRELFGSETCFTQIYRALPEDAML